MSYRDDHDAALLRVAALENEIAHLRKVKEDAPKPRRRSKLPTVGLALAAVTGFAGLMAAVHFGTAAEAAPVDEEVTVVKPAAVELTDLRACLESIQPIADTVDARSMDPRNASQPVSIHTVERSGAACRTELGSKLEHASLPDPLRERLTAWYASENALANTISMIRVYYDANPVALDNYATAPQLWTEYHRAHHARDAAIEELIVKL